MFTADHQELAGCTGVSGPRSPIALGIARTARARRRAAPGTVPHHPSMQGTDVMLAPYPKLLTDPAWKKVEKAAGVSATGVGKTLRDADIAWGKFATQVAGWE